MDTSALCYSKQYEPTSKINLFNPSGENEENLFIHKLKTRIRCYSISCNNSDNFEIKNLLKSSK
jgi:hypothetical protein